MDIPQKIDTIIQRRKQQLPEIEAAIQRIQEAKSVVERFDAFRSQLSGKATEFTEKLLEQLAIVSTDEFYQEYEQSLAQLYRLQARFSREEVNISFVGRAGQGKSLVLQRISGLGSDVIPSSGGAMDCTGARSIISNRQGAETSADITFFSEQEFLGIVNTYVSNLFQGNVPPVTSINAVSKLDKIRLQSMVSSDPVKSERMKHLSDYIDHAAELRNKLGTHTKASKEEIEQYVAQYSHNDPSTPYYDYLIVKEARIFAPFPYDNCGKIVLVDTIGTGATSLGVEEEMLRTVREDSDAIILMMRPEALRGRPGIEHYQLLDQIVKEVSPEYTGKMLFWLINRVETGDARNVDSIPAIISALRQDTRPVADYLNVNCFDEKDVENNLLMPVLEQMSKHLNEIDRMIIDRSNKMLAKLEQAYRKIGSSMERAVAASVNEDERREFRPEIRGSIQRMAYALRTLFFKYEKIKDNDCEPLKQEAEIKLKNILRALPDEEDIQQMLKDATLDPHEIMIHLADILRLQIVNDFLGLNVPLNKLVWEMKRDAVHCLSAPDSGNLAPIIKGTDSEDSVAWLNSLQNRLENNLGGRQYPMICHALHHLREFELRMENFLIYKVRCCLKTIDWLDATQLPPLDGSIRDEKRLAADMRFHLSHYLEIIYKDIRKEMVENYSFPNTAMYAVLRDFFDRTTRTRDTSGNSVMDEWEDLYAYSIPEIWREKHLAFDALRAHSEEWNSLCNAVQPCMATGYFKINRKETY